MLLKLRLHGIDNSTLDEGEIIRIGLLDILFILVGGFYGFSGQFSLDGISQLVGD